MQQTSPEPAQPAQAAQDVGPERRRAKERQDASRGSPGWLRALANSLARCAHAERTEQSGAEEHPVLGSTPKLHASIRCMLARPCAAVLDPCVAVLAIAAGTNDTSDGAPAASHASTRASVADLPTPRPTPRGTGLRTEHFIIVAEGPGWPGLQKRHCFSDRSARHDTSTERARVSEERRRGSRRREWEGARRSVQRTSTARRPASTGGRGCLALATSSRWPLAASCRPTRASR